MLEIDADGNFTNCQDDINWNSFSYDNNTIYQNSLSYSPYEVNTISDINIEETTYSTLKKEFGGCTDELACNYDSNAVCDDNSCEYIDDVDLGEDIITCEESIILDAGLGYDSYLWSTGDTSQVIELTESGDYSVDASLKSEWKWITGENTTVTYFNDFQQYENENCIEMYSSDGFFISSCQDTKFFVLEFDYNNAPNNIVMGDNIEGFIFVDNDFMLSNNPGLSNNISNYYYLSEYQLNWQDASDTVFLVSVEENEYVVILMEFIRLWK